MQGLEYKTPYEAHAWKTAISMTNYNLGSIYIIDISVFSFNEKLYYVCVIDPDLVYCLIQNQNSYGIDPENQVKAMMLPTHLE